MIPASEPKQARSHGGCTTCKIRKVKCDEVKPICNRCSSTGRNCDGYQAIQSLPLSILNNSVELRSYHYFWKQVLPVLPGHYDQSFWGTWLRRACFDEPAIQHAMIAVGALHEGIASAFANRTLAAAQQQSFSIQQYNKAIQHLTGKNHGALPTTVILTSCIIFIMYENIYGRNGEARKHLKNGISILKLWTPSTNSEATAKEEYLMPVLTRGYGHDASTELPMIFDTLENARKHLQIMLDAVYSSVDSAVVSGNEELVVANVSRAKSLLREWHVRFLKLGDPKDVERRRAKILLKLQYTTAFILLVAVLIDDENAFDEHIDKFQHIIDQCEQLAAVESSLLGTDIAKADVFVYGFDLNVLPCLNIIAFKCRDPLLRRKAISLLNEGNRYEGLWNGKTVARIAQRILEIEEAGLPNPTNCTDIPQSHRVSLVAISYNPGDTSRSGDQSSPDRPHYVLELSRNLPDGVPSEKIEELLSIPAHEMSKSWGPGRSPWHMVFQYDPEWAQWKMSRQSEDSSSANEDSEKDVVESTATTGQIKGHRTASKSALSHELRGGTGRPDKPKKEQQTNLFWDHWRLRKIPLQRSRTVAVAMEKEASRGGRSYGDAQATETPEVVPSHLMISLP